MINHVGFINTRQLLNALGNSFHSIDIRCAVKKHEPGWLSLLMLLHFSKTSRAIQTRYQELENDGQGRDAEPFRICGKRTQSAKWKGF